MKDLAVGHGERETAVRLEEHQAELSGYCYRMLGSYAEAEDAVQETMIRAWRNVERFEGRSSLRSWVYRIATNVCLDALAAAKRRALPMDLAEPSPGAVPPEAPEDAALWIGPCPGGDPEATVAASESIRLAFVAALQHLPPKQRATLILRDVLAFSAREVAELHSSTVASVNSALQRARATLAAHRGPADAPGTQPSDAVRRALAERYATAFSRHDMEELNMLLHVDATLCLPPYTKWMCGVPDIQAWLTGPAVGCRGSRLIPTTANGTPAFGQYRPTPDGTGYEPWALQVIEISGNRITGINAFRDTERLFPLFGLPARIGPDSSADTSAPERRHLRSPAHRPKEPRMTWSEHTVVRDGVRISCRGWGGSGPSVVLLHGLAGHAAEWDAIARDLSPGYRVVAVDQRGHGASQRCPRDVSRAAYVADVVAVLEQLGLQRPVLVGQSLGGHTAMLAAAAHPGLFRALVLVEAGPGGPNRNVQAEIGGWLDAWPRPFPSREAAVEFLGGGPVGEGWAAGLVARDGGWWPRFDRDVMVGSLAEIAQRSFWDEWSKVTCPTLAVLGQSGIISSGEIDEMLRLRPETVALSIPGTGHDVHLERPDVLVHVLREVLGEVTRSRTA